MANSIENHRLKHAGWLRAAVLGANDGIISTASLITGMAASSVSYSAIILASFAGLVAGALSMAAGEYVSVSSQLDIEKSDIIKEKKELQTMPEAELRELTEIYIKRGLEPDLAAKVAEQLTKKNALKAHLRDELGITEISQSKPLQAAVVSALLFSAGASIPLIATLLSTKEYILMFVSGTALLSLCLLGGLASYVGGASILRGVGRVAFWGTLAMLMTSGVGKLFDIIV